MADPAFDTADYELLWPRALFVRELAALRAEPDSAELRERIEFLLAEAFLGETPMQDFQAATRWPDDPWSNHGQHLDQLVELSSQLREHHEPKPYWPARRGQEHTTVSRMDAQHRFAVLIGELHGRGYFGRALPVPCIDTSGDVNPADVLAERLGIPDLWPLRPDDWDEDTFFGLIEVFHDLAVRPRTRVMHSYDSCGWHYSTFGTDTGGALYRWKINRLLESAGIELRLAEDGEDIGRLVHLLGDARTDLVECTLASPDPGVAGRVAHAIALFRGRAATEHDKRSAVVALALVLEERRQLLKTALFRDDEGALLHIANKFAIRHQDTKQHTDYDPMFLDWIFWSYLPTIELSDRLLARQSTQISTATP
ncbi:MAG: hypothetical protein ACRDRR_15060 [Pseudonocardiaceae bacterium]